MSADTLGRAALSELVAADIGRVASLMTCTENSGTGGTIQSIRHERGFTTVVLCAGDSTSPSVELQCGDPSKHLIYFDEVEA